MRKAELKQKIITLLEEKYQIAVASTQRAIDAATDEETVPEHKYDTLALEASYLAHGQAMRVSESEEEVRQYRELVLRDYHGKTAGMTAYVELLDEEGEAKAFFIGPTSGGLTVELEGKSVYVLTPGSPLGKAILGKAVGDEVELVINGKHTYYEVDVVE